MKKVQFKILFIKSKEYLETITPFLMSYKIKITLWTLQNAFQGNCN